MSRRLTVWLALASLLIPAGLAAAPQPDFMAQLVARSFFRGVVEGEVAVLAPLCANQVNFDGTLIKGTKAVRQQLAAMIKRARRQGLKLHKLLLLSYKEAVRQFGPPPARIARFIGPRDLIAVAAFQRSGAVAVLTRNGSFWRITALTD